MTEADGSAPSVRFEANVIFVSDVPRAVDWYRRFIGMSVLEERLPEFVHMVLGQAHFFLETASDRRAEGFRGKKPGGRTSLVFGVKDLHDFVEQCRAGGVKIAIEPVQQFWGGWNAVIADQDGNELILDEE